MSAKTIIARQEKEILEFNNMIDTQIQDFEKYKIDVYKSKVDADLLNFKWHYRMPTFVDYKCDILHCGKLILRRLSFVEKV